MSEQSSGWLASLASKFTRNRGQANTVSQHDNQPTGLLKGSEDPLLNLDEESLARTTQEQQTQYIELFQYLSSFIDVRQIRRILIFAPGLSETQAIYQALRAAGNQVSDLSFAIIDADPRIIKRVEQQRIPVSLTSHCQTFAQFLSDRHPDLSADLVFIANPGPAACSPDFGFSPQNIPALTSLISEKGIVVTKGQTHELPEYLNQASILKSTGEPSITGNALSRPFHCWQKNG